MSKHRDQPRRLRKLPIMSRYAIARYRIKLWLAETKAELTDIIEQLRNK